LWFLGEIFRTQTKDGLPNLSNKKLARPNPGQKYLSQTNHQFSSWHLQQYGTMKFDLVLPSWSFCYPGMKNWWDGWGLSLTPWITSCFRSFCNLFDQICIQTLRTNLQSFCFRCNLALESFFLFSNQCGFFEWNDYNFRLSNGCCWLVCLFIITPGSKMRMKLITRYMFYPYLVKLIFASLSILTLISYLSRELNCSLEIFTLSVLYFKKNFDF